MSLAARAPRRRRRQPEHLYHTPERVWESMEENEKLDTQIALNTMIQEETNGSYMPDSWKKNRRNPRKLTLELIQTISSCIARHVTTSFDEYDKRVNKYVPEYTVHKNKMFTDMITHVM
eukprot:1444389-Rhodomonas_salina.1